MSEPTRGLTAPLVTHMDEAIERFRRCRTRRGSRSIRTGGRMVVAHFFQASASSLELRKNVPVWRRGMVDGARVCVHPSSSEIEAVRIR